MRPNSDHIMLCPALQWLVGSFGVEAGMVRLASEALREVAPPPLCPFPPAPLFPHSTPSQALCPWQWLVPWPGMRSLQMATPPSPPSGLCCLCHAS